MFSERSAANSGSVFSSFIITSHTNISPGRKGGETFAEDHLVAFGRPVVEDLGEKGYVRPFRQLFFEEVPGECFNAVGQFRLGYFLAGSPQRRRAVEDTRAKARIFATGLYAEGPGRPADIKQMA